jgi:hypothetical protein
MGSGVFGGMIIATFVAPVFIPLFFTLLARKPRPMHHHGHGGDHHDGPPPAATPTIAQEDRS